MRILFLDSVYDYSQSEKSFFRCVMWSLLLGLFYPVLNDGSAVSNLISLGCTTLAIFAIVLYYSNGKSPKTSRLLTFFAIVVAYMVLVGIRGGSLSVGRTTLMLTITQDVRFVALFWLGGLFATSERYMAYFHTIMKRVAMITVIMCLVAVVLVILSRSFIQRGSEDNTIYHLWWSSTTAFMYCGYFGLICKTKERKWFILVLMLYFILGMAFLKRSCFIDTLFILAFSLFLTRAKRASNTLGVVAFILILAIFVLAAFPVINEVVFSSLFGRFNEVSTVDEFDRMIEWVQFQDNSSLTQRLFGYGIGNYQISDRFGSGRELSVLNALHLGYANIIYKGGVLYALFYLLLYISVFRRWFSSKQKSNLYLVCFGVAISALVSLFFEGSWTYTIAPFCISAPIFYAANYK